MTGTINEVTCWASKKKKKKKMVEI
jgi:hypothetical protein